MWTSYLLFSLLFWALRLCVADVECDAPLFSWENADISGWLAGTASLYSGSCALSNMTSVPEHATNGSYSLMGQYNVNSQADTRAVYYKKSVDFDMSAYSLFNFDMYVSSNTASYVTVALTTGDTWQWFESQNYGLTVGENYLSVELNVSTWKCAASAWFNNATIQNLNFVRQISIVVYLNSDPASGTEDVFIDNIRLCNDVQYVPSGPQFQAKGLAFQITFAVFVVLTFVLGVFALAMVLKHPTHFKKHNTNMCIILTLGVIISDIAAAMVIPESSPATCVLFPWLLGIAFVLVYGCLFIKTWVLYKVWMGSLNFKTKVVSPFYMTKFLSIFMGFFVLFLIIWTATARPVPVQIMMANYTLQLHCVSKPIQYNHTIWAVFLSCQGLWLIFGAVLSVLTRGVRKDLNESVQIALTIYNIVVVSVIAIPLAFMLETIPDGQPIIQIVSVLAIFNFTLVVLFFSDWCKILLGTEMSMLSPFRKVTGSTSSSSSGLNSPSASSSQSHPGSP